MEGADADARPRDDRVHAFAHLGRRLIGEGNRQNVPGLDAILQQVGNAARDDARLSRPRTGHHE